LDIRSFTVKTIKISGKQEMWHLDVTARVCDEYMYEYLMYTVFRKKNTHSHFLSYLHEQCVDLNKNCSEYT